MLDRFDWWIGLAIAVTTLVPVEAIGIFSGYYYASSNPIVNISLTSYSVLALIGQLYILHILKSGRFLIDNKLFVLLLLCLVSIIVPRIISAGLLSNKLFDNYLFPLMFFLIIVVTLPSERVSKVLVIIFYFVLFNAVIAIVEYYKKSNILFDNYFLMFNDWYKGIVRSSKYGISYRSGAFLGHPLILSSYLVLGIIMLKSLNIKYFLQKLCYYLILLFALYTTNSRGGFLLVLVYFMYELFRKSRLVGLSAIVMIVLLYLPMLSLYQDIFSRDSSGASLGIRLLALSLIPKIPVNILFWGAGFNQASNVMAAIIGSSSIKSNFEIGPLIILVEMGFITVFFMTVLIIYIINKSKKLAINNRKIKDYNNIITMLFFTSISFLTYNSIGNSGTLNYLPWLLLALLYTSVKKNQQSEK